MWYINRWLIIHNDNALVFLKDFDKNLTLPQEFTSIYKAYKPDVNDDRMLKNSKFSNLEELHQLIWKQIAYLQEGGDCEKKKILHCEVNHNFAGFGSIVHRYGACIQVAYGLGRMFFIEQNPYKHFGGLTQWLLPESTRCGYIKKKYHSILRDSKEYYKNICKTNDKKCYLKNGYDLNNTYKIIDYRPEPSFPLDRHIPGSIPQVIEKALKKFGVKHPSIWFSAQMISYLILRPNNRFLRALNVISHHIKFQHPIVAMHIRHGDKVLKESLYYDETFYANPAKLIFNKSHADVKKPYVYLATDDVDSKNKIKEHLPSQYRIISMPKEIRKAALDYYHIGKTPPIQVTESMLIDLYFLAQSDYVICTLTSNVCRLIYLMKLARSPYKLHEDTIKSLDMQMYYEFHGYRYNPGEKNVRISVQRNKNTSPVDVEILSYDKGDMFIKMDNIRDSKYGKIMKVRELKNKPRIGYIFVDDVITWPGYPEYYFFPENL